MTRHKPTQCKQNSVKQKHCHLQRQAPNRKILANEIFQRNNPPQKSSNNIIDLHGLFVCEAIERVAKRVAAAKYNNESELTVIVGQGIHSKDGRPKLKPAIVQFAEENEISYRVNVPNPGCIRFKFTSTGDKENRPENRVLIPTPVIQKVHHPNVPVQKPAAVLTARPAVANVKPANINPAPAVVTARPEIVVAQPATVPAAARPANNRPSHYLDNQFNRMFESAALISREIASPSIPPSLYATKLEVVESPPNRAKRNIVLVIIAIILFIALVLIIAMLKYFGL